MMSRMSKVVALLVIPLTFCVKTHANTSEEWTLEMNDSCNSFQLELPLPEVDATCSLDNRSGNPSNWFNPFETCSMDFDMIGLPSLSDISAGIAGSVCDAVKGVKEQTLDKVLDEINADIPDNLYDEINGNVDLNEYTSGNNSNGNSWQNQEVAQPEVGENNCYTTDTEGNTVIVPCDIAKSNAQSPNTCYEKSNQYGSPFSPVPCSRFTQDREICIARWTKDPTTGLEEPVLRACTAALHASSTEACTDYTGETKYCRELEKPPTQKERQCSFERKLALNETESYIDSCYNIEKACYGHLNGQFQAAQCQQFHDLYFQNQNSQGVFDDFWSNVRHNRESFNS